MSLIQAILMGVIQGLTEFLPVSSSGHLALFKILFGVETETGILYDVLLHVATLLAICFVYFKDIRRLFVEGVALIKDAFVNVVIFIRNKMTKDNERYRKVITNGYRKFVMLVLVSTLPTGVIGFFGRKAVALAAEILIVPGICLIITAVLLFVADRVKEGEKTPKNVTYTNAFAIGIAQGIATMPGISRSGMTITACLLSGYQRSFAVKYSFIMSIPAILGALVLELTEISTVVITPQEVICYVVGMLFAAIVGYVCIKLMLVIVRKKKFTFFAIYCLIVGVISIFGYFYMV